MNTWKVVKAIGIIGVGLTGLAQNREKRITPVDPAQRQSFVKSSKAAVVVGIGDYPPETGLTRLQFARRDAEAVAAEFRSQGYAVRLLTDTQATRGIIMAAVRDAADVVSADGTLLFYFSGHGFAPQPGRNILATYGVTAADMGQDGLNVDALRQRMQQSVSRRKVLLIDACRSEPGKGGEARTFSALSASSGTRMLLSTQMGRISYENDQFQQGVFTHFLLKGLRGEAAGFDGLVTFRDVAEFVSGAVRQWSFEQGQTQIPVELSDEASGDFLLAQPAAISEAFYRTEAAPSAPPPLPSAETSAVRTDSASRPAGPVTFHRDVEPILQARCQSCHRPGESGPMSFLNYAQTRPWAKAMRAAVTSRKMPPWFADPNYGHFSNDRRLSEKEISTITAWAEGGAPEGSPRDAPRPATFVDGWSIKPDVVIEMPRDFEVPATGAVPMQEFHVSTGFKDDKFIQAVEVRPGNPSAVLAITVAAGGELLARYQPGTQPLVMRSGQSKLIEAGQDLVVRILYAANGKPQRDRSRIGLVLSTQVPTQRLLTLAASNRDFVIPSGAANYEVRASADALPYDARLVALQPVMNLRGKSFEYRVVFPNGNSQVVLRVPQYSFYWRLRYELEEPIALPRGSRIECIAWYDNSAGNPLNPDPARQVRYGDQMWQEQLVGSFDVAIDAKVLFPNPK